MRNLLVADWHHEPRKKRNLFIAHCRETKPRAGAIAENCRLGPVRKLENRVGRHCEQSEAI